jgi:hypothetical protein
MATEKVVDVYVAIMIDLENFDRCIVAASTDRKQFETYQGIIRERVKKIEEKLESKGIRKIYHGIVKATVINDNFKYVSLKVVYNEEGFIPAEAKLHLDLHNTKKEDSDLFRKNVIKNCLEVEDEEEYSEQDEHDILDEYDVAIFEEDNYEIPSLKEIPLACTHEVGIHFDESRLNFY